MACSGALRTGDGARAWLRCATIVAFAKLAACGMARPVGPPPSSSPGLPSRDEVSLLLRTHGSGAAVVEPAPALIDRWELRGPFPTLAESDLSVEPGALTARIAARNDDVASSTQGTECAARELAHFAMAHAQAIPHDLMDFIAIRCGVRSPTLIPVVHRETVPTIVTDAEYIAHVAPAPANEPATPRPSTSAPSPLLVASYVLLRDGDRAVLAGVSALRVATLTSPPAVRDVIGLGRVVELAGRVNEPVSQVSAYITRGALDSVACQRVLGVRAPEFRLRCELPQGAPEAWIDIYARRPRATLDHRVMTLSLPLHGEPDRVFVRPARADTVDASATADGFRRALTLVNEARLEAGSPPLELAEAQSNQLCAGLTAFLAARPQEGLASVRDRIVLAMMAGWQVPESVFDASFLIGAGAGSGDLRRTVAMELRHPGDRRALLSREFRWMAVCPQMVEGRVDRIMWTTYATLRENDRRSELAEAMAWVAADRARFSRPAPPWNEDVMEVTDEAVRALESDPAADPADVMQRTLRTAVARFGPSMIWVLPFAADGTIEFPVSFLDREPTSLGISVAHWRSPRAAWAQRLVYVLAVVPPPAN